MAGLRACGLTVEQRGALVVATLDCGPSGTVRSQAVGADPPDDFPNVPPHWLHLPKGIRLPGDAGQASELGDDWWRWSRPHPKWKGGESGARSWIAHVRSLLLTAEEG